MIVTKYKIDAKTIKGKKIRRASFSLILIAIAFLVAVAIWSIVKDGFSSFLWAICLLPIFLLIPAFFFSNTVRCILGTEKLYFFDCDVIEQYDNSILKKTTCNCCGSVDYSDIVRTDVDVKSTRTGRATVTLICGNKSISITGVDSRLGKTIDKKRENRYNTSETESKDVTFTPDTIKREGLWAETAKIFVDGKFADRIDESIAITSMEWFEFLDEDDGVDAIDITFERNGKKMMATVGSEGLDMYIDDEDIDKNIPILEISDTDAMFDMINKFLIENS